MHLRGSVPSVSGGLPSSAAPGVGLPGAGVSLKVWTLTFHDASFSRVLLLPRRQRRPRQNQNQNPASARLPAESGHDSRQDAPDERGKSAASEETRLRPRTCAASHPQSRDAKQRLHLDRPSFHGNREERGRQEMREGGVTDRRGRAETRPFQPD
ncbi:hypothetical protein FQA47_024738 [Oryzias melastigma]|uniref:Uncharacterized protein n=1 Tax=Oryzias melastigma TaxID=30732 RepID=A0A834FGV0_ORYME|nr:hypothetical protein FQA47_024738 [Oryzias melastigma]